MNFKLSWRNLWRNKRRSIITIASIFFAVFLSLAAASVNKGTWGHMLGNVIKMSTGYGQIHEKGYWEDPVIDNIFNPDTVIGAASASRHIDTVVPRLESFALATNNHGSKGAAVVGIDPFLENELTGLKERLIAGQYLKTGDQSIIVSEGLADHLKSAVGDTIILLGQGYHGNTAVGMYEISGIVKFPTPDLNNSMIYLPLEEAQYLHAAPELVTSLVIIPHDPEKLDKSLKTTRSALGSDYEVMEWQQLIPELVSAMQMDKASDFIFFFIIYLVIGFGIFGTILMMTNERKHEFGVLLAIGMKRTKLVTIVFIETILIAIFGILAGTVFTLPFLAYFYNNPIRVEGGNIEKIYESYGFEPVYVFSMSPEIFTNAAVIIMAISIIVMIYPLWSLYRLRPVDAMRS